MIGVLAHLEETTAVEEFFQLFKTPWETFVPGHTYDVVITTVGYVPETNAQLILAFGGSRCSMDRQWGLRLHSEVRAGILECPPIRLPLYGQVLTFEETDGARGSVRVGERFVGLKMEVDDRRVLRLGYDLFKEVQYLLSTGQPLEHALVPTLDLHIDILRRWILEAGLTLVEIPPVPAGCSFAVCLTHDIDFIGIRSHRFDHTMWGFLFRATVGAVWKFACGKMGLKQLARSWTAAASLPFVYLGWVKDYWIPFEWYLSVEKGLGVTYYLIPFKGRAGERVRSKHPERRAAAYDVSELAGWMALLQQAGCEIGVHGIDAWHSAEKGREEKSRISFVTGESKIGIRMHWLLADASSFEALEEADFDYDATMGYNETPGYRAGTSQVYRPAGARRLLELPLHIQDGALFFPQRLDLSEREAWDLCASFTQHARTCGGVLTVLWHDRSHGPERFWGEFYARLLTELKSFDPWFCTAGNVVEWFRARRTIAFARAPNSAGSERVTAHFTGPRPLRPFLLRVHRRATNAGPGGSMDGTIDLEWCGGADADLSLLVETQDRKSFTSECNEELLDELGSVAHRAA